MTEQITRWQIIGGIWRQSKIVVTKVDVEEDKEDKEVD